MREWSLRRVERLHMSALVAKAHLSRSRLRLSPTLILLAAYQHARCTSSPSSSSS